ncbi:MAG: hypothetical protein RIR26_341 [Pseudomonadota bacterium]|jgi:hypothetical protein
MIEMSIQIKNKITPLLPLACVVLSACKPVSTSRTLESSIALDSTAAIAALVDSGLEQLEQQQDIDTESSSSDALGLTSDRSWRRSGNELKSLFGRVTGAWHTLQKNPCKLWAPIVRSVGREMNQPYFFTGVSAEAGAGLHLMKGRDYVWDLYNLQFGVFNYTALESVFGAGTVGAGVNAYAGLAFGHKDDVDSAWSGRFASVGASGSLPVLSDYFSGHLTFFSAQTPQGSVDYRFKGGSVGISAGIAVPTPAPGALLVASGHWTLDKKETQKIAQQLTRWGIANSIQGSATCQGACVRMDNLKAGAGYTGRAVNLARSMAAILMANNVALASFGLDKIMLLAIATGAYRDTKNSAYACRL